MSLLPGDHEELMQLPVIASCTDWDNISFLWSKGVPYSYMFK